jgi:hypothetical protein
MKGDVFGKINISATPARQMGGQHVGNYPRVIRAEIRDLDGFVIGAVEVNDGYHDKSQHAARTLAVNALELIISEYRRFP